MLVVTILMICCALLWWKWSANTSLTEQLSGAITTGDIAVVRRLLDENPGLVNANSAHIALPLEHAAQTKNLEMVRLLLDKGAQVNPVSQPGSISPLCWAASYGDVPMLTLLLDRGANPNAISPYTPTPLFMAAYSTTPNAEVVKLLISRGADVNSDATPDSGWPGRTALAAAQAPHPTGFPETPESLKQRQEIIRLLKRAGATR